MLKMRRADIPTRPEYSWLPEKRFYKLYHGTSDKFLSSIKEEGLKPFLRGGPEIRDVLVWVGEDYERVKDHARKKVEKIGGMPIVLHLNIDTSEIGLHRAIIPGFYTTHESIPLSMIERVEFLDEETRMGKIVRIGRVVEVPAFNTEEEMQRFVDNLSLDDTPKTDVWNPETGEVIMESGETKRKQLQQKYKKEVDKEDRFRNVSPIIPSFRVENEYWEGEDDFYSFYRVVTKSLRDSLDSESLRTLEEAGYDIDVDLPIIVERKDKKELNKWDDSNILEFATYENWKLKEFGAPSMELHLFRDGRNRVRFRVAYL